MRVEAEAEAACTIVSPPKSPAEKVAGFLGLGRLGP
jgi:hypothetical protein